MCSKVRLPLTSNCSIGLWTFGCSAHIRTLLVKPFFHLE
ncbi:hypothetical protein M3J09_004877 [Ascochyta lentis]